MSKILKGIGCSNGFAKAKVFKLIDPVININKFIIDPKDINSEIEKLNLCLETSIKEIETLEEIALRKLNSEKSVIFQSHILILSDEELLKEIKSIIKNEHANADYAVWKISSKYQKIFAKMDDPYFQERAADIKDVSKRLIKHLLNIPILNLDSIQEEIIIVAEDLSPSQTIQLNPQFVKAFVCQTGGKTSHAAILANSLMIPAVLGVNDILNIVNNGDILIVNGGKGEVIINPNQDQMTEWHKCEKSYLEQQKLLAKFATLPTITKDKKILEIEANIGSPDDINNILRVGAEGVGLFRSEFLYMDKDHFPTEEEQFQEYKKVLIAMKNKKVIVRTLDIGGDKNLSYYSFPKEMNPFLGYRAIRFCLDKKDIFITQLRALLRASVYGNLWIMFPMIATVNEFRQAKKIFEEQKEALIKENIVINNNIKVGMMIEIPSAAVTIDLFTEYSDFFSIGTNDLIQYCMAADRGNENISYLYQPLNPSILRIINNVIKVAKKANKPVGMCGEMAANPLAAIILVGMGLEMFSMSASSILRTRKIINNIDTNTASKISEHILKCKTEEEVKEMIKGFGSVD